MVHKNYKRGLLVDYKGRWAKLVSSFKIGGETYYRLDVAVPEKEINWKNIEAKKKGK